MVSGPARSLPGSVRIREVGPRDGFQNEPEVIATERKVELIDALARTGLGRLEVTSFVRADVIPQLADAAAVLAAIDVPEDVSVSVLIPNERGLDAALKELERGVGERPAFDEVNVFLSASETHNRKNVNRTIAESLAGVEQVLRRARRRACAARGSSRPPSAAPTRARSPSSGSSRSRGACATRARRRSASATRPGWPTRCRSAPSSRVPAPSSAGVELTAHFHNTRGQGLANVLAALEAGVESFESSFGELGGCPVPAGATGNIATEDLVSMLDEMGIETGVDLPRCSPARAASSEILGRPLGSHTLLAGPVDWHRERLEPR